MRLCFATILACALAGTMLAAGQRDLGREVLEPNDGWAALGEGVTGGSAATPDHVYVVRNRQELVAALAYPASHPKIVYVDGTIDANVDDNNQPLTCQDYYRDGYTLECFLAYYDPAGPWGPNPPANTTGSLEASRRASAAAQSARVRIRVPDNTTIVGLDSRARLRGTWLDLRGSSSTRRVNIIIRNLTIEDVYDCFPAWTPSVAADGSWPGAKAGLNTTPFRSRFRRVWIDNAFPAWDSRQQAAVCARRVPDPRRPHRRTNASRTGRSRGTVS
jgi:pectate lyase